MNYFDFESRKEEKMSSWLTVIWLQIKKAYFLFLTRIEEGLGRPKISK